MENFGENWENMNMLENKAISGKRTVNESSLSGPPNTIKIEENSDFFFFIDSRIKPNTRGCFAFGEFSVVCCENSAEGLYHVSTRGLTRIQPKPTAELRNLAWISAHCGGSRPVGKRIRRVQVRPSGLFSSRSVNKPSGL